MTCKEAEKMIPAFLAGDLEEDDFEDFLRHIEKCGLCKEELSIQLLVSEGMDRLESGSSFNLKESVELKLRAGDNRIRFRDNLRKILYILEFILICGLGICGWLCFYALK